MSKAGGEAEGKSCILRNAFPRKLLSRNASTKSHLKLERVFSRLAQIAVQLRGRQWGKRCSISRLGVLGSRDAAAGHPHTRVFRQHKRSAVSSPQ